MSELLAVALLKGRASTARRSLSALERELGAMGLDWNAPPLEAAFGSRVTARRLGASVAKDWAAAAGEDGIRAGRSAVWPRLDVIATTENATAFNAARADVLEALDVPGMLLGKQWEAELDKHTCQRCERLDGMIVLATERFPDGEPGAVHPRCRCTEHPVWISGTTAAPAARKAAPEERRQQPLPQPDKPFEPRKWSYRSAPRSDER